MYAKIQSVGEKENLFTKLTKKFTYVINGSTDT